METNTLATRTNMLLSTMARKKQCHKNIVVCVLDSTLSDAHVRVYPETLITVEGK